LSKTSLTRETQEKQGKKNRGQTTVISLTPEHQYRSTSGKYPEKWDEFLCDNTKAGYDPKCFYIYCCRHRAGSTNDAGRCTTDTCSEQNSMDDANPNKSNFIEVRRNKMRVSINILHEK
jgi:hypothetical protein